MNNDLISREALKKAINELGIPIYGKMVLKAIDNAPTVEPQMPREYRQALEVLEYIKERYILVEKSPKDDPNALLVAGQQNETK